METVSDTEMRAVNLIKNHKDQDDSRDNSRDDSRDDSSE